MSGTTVSASNAPGRPELLRLLREEWLKQDEALLESARHDPKARQRLRDLISLVLAREQVVWVRRDREALAVELSDELVGLGPLEPYLRDDEVTEIMVNGPARIYVERLGTVTPAAGSFRDRDHLESIIQRIVAPLGRRIDQSQPFVDARLPNGSRVHAIIQPLAVNGPYLTIRKFHRHRFTPEDLVASGACSPEMMDFLARAVAGRCTLVIAGGTGSGKTTTLNALSSFLSPRERIITIEDAAELRLNQEHIVSLETRLANNDGKGEVSIRTLLRNALRMRPDRIIVGEVRGKEAFDLLQAMNTGHEGGMTTVHANGPIDAIHRLTAMILTADEGLPHPVVTEQLGTTIDLIVQQARLSDGKRCITEIAAVTTIKGKLSIVPLYSFRPEPAGKGTFVAGSGPLPERLTRKLAFMPSAPQGVIAS